MSLGTGRTGLVSPPGVWPSLSALNSSGYTAQGPGSRAWYLDAGVRREAELGADGATWWPLPTASYLTYAALNTDLPPGLMGRTTWVKRLCGHGYFQVIDNGTRWAVITGQRIISDAGVGSSTDGYALIATGTSFVSLVSYTLPAGIIGDGESWDTDVMMKNDGVYASGTDIAAVRIEGATITNGQGAPAANRAARSNGVITRLGTSIARSSGGISYGNISSTDLAIDFSLAKTIDVGISPGASTNTSRIRHWSFGRQA